MLSLGAIEDGDGIAVGDAYHAAVKGLAGEGWLGGEEEYNENTHASHNSSKHPHSSAAH